MKLLSIKTASKTAGATVQNIQAPKLQGVKIKGYINLISRKKVETIRGKVRIFKTKPSIKAIYTGISRAFNQSLVQAGIFEARITQAKKALKDAKKMILTTLEWFNLHVAMCKAVLHLRSFKLSLPKYITNLLF